MWGCRRISLSWRMIVLGLVQSKIQVQGVSVAVDYPAQGDPDWIIEEKEIVTQTLYPICL